MQVEYHDCSKISHLNLVAQVANQKDSEGDRAYRDDIKEITQSRAITQVNN